MNVTETTLDIPNDPTPWLRVRPNDSKEYCVLWLQGWTSTIEKHRDLLTRLADRTSVTFAMLNYAGHGNHPIPLEETTREQQFREALFAYDKLKSEGYKHIIVCGTSFGGYLAALLSAERTPYAVILRAADAHLDDEFTVLQKELAARPLEERRQFRRAVSKESNLQAISAIKKFDGSVYVVEHEIDSIIPRNIPRAYFAAAKRGNYIVIPATDHSPARMANPPLHFAYIEEAIVSIVNLIKKEVDLSGS